mgnify:CR=1 FL=1
MTFYRCRAADSSSPTWGRQPEGPAAGWWSLTGACDSVVPHVDVPVRGGMTQLFAMPRDGKRLIFALFQAGQVGMLDISDPNRFKQLSIVNLGVNSGPHSVHLTHDDRRLVVTDYFLEEGDIGRIHLDGDHKVRVLDVSRRGLTVDPAFHVINSTRSSRPGRRGRMASG